MNNSDTNKAKGTCPKSHHYLYATWGNMMSRCYTKSSRDYPQWGGRGITVCVQWRNHNTGFYQFLADMGERPANRTLDRVDNDGNYNPENCRWATVHEQMGNTSRNNRHVGVKAHKASGGWIAQGTFNKVRSEKWFARHMDAVIWRVLWELEHGV